MSRVSRLCATCRRCCPTSPSDADQYVEMQLARRDDQEVEYYASPCRVIEARQYEAEAIEARHLQEEIKQMKSGKKSKKNKKSKSKKVESKADEHYPDSYGFDETAVNEKYPHLKLDLRNTTQKSSKPRFHGSFENTPIYSRIGETMSDDGRSDTKTPYMAEKKIKTIQTHYGHENYSYVDISGDDNPCDNLGPYYDNPEVDVSPLEDEIVEVKTKRVPSIKLIPASKQSTFDENSLVSPVGNVKTKTAMSKGFIAKSSVHSKRKAQPKRSPIDLFQGDDLTDFDKHSEPILSPMDIQIDTNKEFYAREHKDKCGHSSMYSMASSIDDCSSTTVKNIIIESNEPIVPNGSRGRRQSVQSTPEDIRSVSEHIERRQTKDRAVKIIQSSQRRATLIIEESDEEDGEGKIDEEVFRSCIIIQFVQHHLPSS